MTTATATMAGSTTMESTSSSNMNSASHSILSDKVNRALQVRTDTPAMKAALEALASPLSSARARTSTSVSAPATSSSSSNVEEASVVLVDSRTVRHCMEDDALQQALILQRRLETLVLSVRELKKGATDMAELCRSLQAHSRMSVVNNYSSNSNNSHNNEQQPTTTLLAHDMSATNNTPDSSQSQSALVQEQQLASTLAAAFHKRHTAQEHLRGVELVLEKLDPSPEDARLIRHYTFDDVDISNANNNNNNSFHSVNGLAFLAALERLSQQLQAASKTPSALGYLDALQAQQEQAYERIYHWLQAVVRVATTNNNQQQHHAGDDTDDSYFLDSSELVQRSLQLLLLYVPAFGQHILELVAQERRSWATKHFLLALTIGVHGMPPLEIRAHDAVAYTGDMLALVFQTISGLSDLCHSVILIPPPSPATTSSDHGEDVSAAADDNDDDDDRMTPASMISICSGGLARPLKSRILQVVTSLAQRPDDGGSHNNSSMGDSDDDDDDDNLDLESLTLQTRLERLYDICGLLLFYQSALVSNNNKNNNNNNNPNSAGLLDSSTAVVQAVTECLVQATAGLEATIRVYCATLDPAKAAELVCGLWQSLSELRTTSPGLSLATATTTTSNTKDNVDSTTSDNDDDAAAGAAHNNNNNNNMIPAVTRRVLSLEWIAETLLQASLPHVQNVADIGLLQKGLQACKVAGLSVTTAEQLDQQVEELQTNLVDSLVEHEAQKVLDLVGLANVATALQHLETSNNNDNNNNDTILSTVPGLLPHELEHALTQFYASLYAPPLPSLDSLQDTLVRRRSRQAIAQRVTQVYRNLHARISSNSSGDYDNNMVVLLKHTPDQVETLFST